MPLRSADQIFDEHKGAFRPSVRTKAKAQFRRAVRMYLVYRRKVIYDPASGRKRIWVEIGGYWAQQKKQRRFMTVTLRAHRRPGRPSRPEVEFLISRLCLMWRVCRLQRPTITHKLNQRGLTPFERFAQPVLLELGASDLRRYMERYWSKRKRLGK